MPNLSILRFSCSGYLEYRKLFLISYCDRWTRVSRHGIILYTCAAFFGRRSPWRGRFWVSGEFHWPTLRPADQYLCSGCGRQRAADQPLVRPPRRLSYLQRHLEPHRYHVSCSSNPLCTFTSHDSHLRIASRFSASHSYSDQTILLFPSPNPPSSAAGQLVNLSKFEKGGQ